MYEHNIVIILTYYVAMYKMPYTGGVSGSILRNYRINAKDSFNCAKHGEAIFYFIRPKSFKKFSGIRLCMSAN